MRASHALLSAPSRRRRDHVLSLRSDGRPNQATHITEAKATVTPLPGFGMAGRGGELLVDLSPASLVLGLQGAPWQRQRPPQPAGPPHSCRQQPPRPTRLHPGPPPRPERRHPRPLGPDRRPRAAHWAVGSPAFLSANSGRQSPCWRPSRGASIPASPKQAPWRLERLG